jgi:hypothetical protein
VRPHIIGSKMGFRDVRAVADLARAEEWDDIYSAVLPTLRHKTGLSRASDKVRQRIKQVGLSPLALIGLAGIVGVTALVVNRRKK